MAHRLMLTLLLLLAAAVPGQAQDWPPKTVRVMVPFGPGSTPDIVARLVADGLSRKYPDSTFLVENKPGASGNIGTDAVAKAAPDGATIGVSIGGPLAINTLLFAKRCWRSLQRESNLWPVSEWRQDAPAKPIRPKTQ